MKKLKEKVLKTIILLTVVSSTLPFFCHDVYADTISQSDIQGVERVLVNSTYLDQTVTNSGNTYKYYSFDYEVTVLLKDYYLGWIQGTFQTSYKTFDNANWQVQNSSCTTVSKSYYVNDNKFSTSFTVTAWIMVNQQGNVDPAGSYTTSFNLSNSNVVAYQDLNSIDTVIDILNDINTVVSIDVMDELQDIGIELGLINSNIESLLNRYEIQPESFPFILECLYKLELTDVNGVSFDNLPMFKIKNGDILAEFQSRNNSSTDPYRETVLVMCMNKSVSINNISNSFSLDNGSFTEVGAVILSKINGVTWRLYRIKIGNFTTATSTNKMTYIGNDSDTLVVPIYLNLSSVKTYSSEFALRYALEPNSYLQNIQDIAQGTQQSNTSSSELESNSSDFNDVAGDVYNLENSFNTGLNNSLQQIDTSFDVGNTFGSKFLLAADWVRVQFNTITASNPFGTILSFSLLLGVALLIIGKVLG